MNHTTHIFKALLAIPLATALTFTACSDWDDHYDKAGQDQTLISGQSLWETINGNPELSNFASVVKAAGYDRSLAGAQAFSVFAPVNSDFSAEEAQALINTYNTEKAANTRDNDNTTIKEFLQNHIALYNHSVSPETNDSIVMMNGKYQKLTSSTFGDKSLLSVNQACANGILYTINGEATYYPNVFEYLSKDSELDSVAAFLNSFNVYVFDAASSVPGEIVDGKTQYLDSVVNLENDEMHQYLSYIDSEDSSFWFVAPTNDVWNTLVPQYEKYFQYDNSIEQEDRDSLTWANARFSLIGGSSFSRTKNTDASIRDSAMSTRAVSYTQRKSAYGSYDLKYYQYDQPFASGGVFYGTTNTECSNGQVMKASQWNFTPEQTFLQTIIVEGEDGDRQDSVRQQTTNYPLTTHNVLTSNPYYNQISDHSYTEISPKSNSDIAAYFSLPNLLSNVGYDIYVTTVPALAGDTLASDFDRRPTKFRVYLRISNADGQMGGDVTNRVPRNTWTVLDGKDNTTSRSDAYFETTKDEVNTFKIANNVTVPYTTYRAGVSPRVELVFENAFRRTNEVNEQTGTYNRILRIDRIVVTPHQEEAQN